VRFSGFLALALVGARGVQKVRRRPREAVRDRKKPSRKIDKREDGGGDGGRGSAGGGGGGCGGLGGGGAENRMYV
jgi:hypothetical protein